MPSRSFSSCGIRSVKVLLNCLLHVIPGLDKIRPVVHRGSHARAIQETPSHGDRFRSGTRRGDRDRPNSPKLQGDARCRVAVTIERAVVVRIQRLSQDWDLLMEYREEFKSSTVVPQNVSTKLLPLGRRSGFYKQDSKWKSHVFDRSSRQASPTSVGSRNPSCQGLGHHCPRSMQKCEECVSLRDGRWNRRTGAFWPFGLRLVPQVCLWRFSLDS